MKQSQEGSLVVLYDGECGFCKVMVAILLRWDRVGRLVPVAIQSAYGEELLVEMPPARRLQSWHLIDDNCTVHSGGAAIPVVFAALPDGRPIAWITSRLPGATARAYGWIAAHRVLLGRLLNARPRAWAARVVAERGCLDPNGGGPEAEAQCDQRRRR